MISGSGGGLKEKYAVREAVKLTEGRYGDGVFRRFFAARDRQAPPEAAGLLPIPVKIQSMLHDL